MGGKSSSSSSSNSTSITETATADASGVITGNVLQGEITYTDYFPEDVGNFLTGLGGTIESVFGGLVDLSNKALDQAGAASGNAVEKVATHVEQQTQPELSVVRDLIPIMMFAVAGFLVYSYFKGKK